MTRSIGRRRGVIGGLALTVTTTLGVAGLVTPAAAAAPNSCRVLRRSEIAAAFGGTVSRGRHGLRTPESTQCEYQIGPDGDRPAGTVTVHVMTTGARSAYRGLATTTGYVPVDGLPKSLYAEKLHVVNVLRHGVLLGVQGSFVITDPLPVRFYDDRTQLTELAGLGVGRV